MPTPPLDAELDAGAAEAADAGVEAGPARRRVVFVLGAAHSGTSALAGSLRALGMAVPEPERASDEVNPRGYAESRWVVDLHTELLGRCRVVDGDARPGAWFEAGKLGNLDRLRGRVHDWLEQQFVVHGPELVVKDPRLVWFTGLWRSAALRCDATPSYLIALRHPAETVAGQSAAEDPTGQGAAASSFDAVRRTSSWVNTLLHAERATRGSARAVVRYADLLDDWTVPVFGAGQRLDLAVVATAQANDVRAVHAFLDPGLRRSAATWADVEVPPRLRDLAEATWTELGRLAVDPDQSDVHDELDRLRGEFADLYGEAEAIAWSTAAAARLRIAEAPAGAGSAVVVRRGADRVPHGVRALVPAGARRGLRRMLGRSR